MKRKICVVVTARPSYSRIRSTLYAIKNHPDLELQLVVAASALLDRFGNVIEVMEHDGFDITARVHTILEGGTLVTSVKSTGLGIIELSTVFANLQPDMVLTVADRFETLATAVAASYMNIPLVHVQGGEVTGSIDEKVRHAVTKLADFHFVSTQKAHERVIRMGEIPEHVYVTGCPSIDIAADVAAAPSLDFDPFGRYGGVGALEKLKDDYIIVMQHPVTTEYQSSREQINETLQALKNLDVQILWFWPNVDAGEDGASRAIRAFRENENAANFHFFKNMKPRDFLRLVYNSRAIVGNSSVAIRECSYLGVPAINIGTRQQGRDRGHNVIDVDYDADAIRIAVEAQIAGGRKVPDYTYGNAGAGKIMADLMATLELTYEKRLTY